MTPEAHTKLRRTPRNSTSRCAGKQECRQIFVTLEKYAKLLHNFVSFFESCICSKQCQYLLVLNWQFKLLFLYLFPKSYLDLSNKFSHFVKQPLSLQSPKFHLEHLKSFFFLLFKKNHTIVFQIYSSFNIFCIIMHSQLTTRLSATRSSQTATKHYTLALASTASMFGKHFISHFSSKLHFHIHFFFHSFTEKASAAFAKLPHS